MSTALRPHQERAIERLRASLASGKRRPVLQAPTGAGKTLTSAKIVSMALEKGKRVIFTCPAISLIDQTVEKFQREGIEDIGVIQADHWMTNSAAQVQVASVQTLARRTIPQADLVIVDESHNQHKNVLKWMAHPDWKSVPFIGLSATPWARGMGKHWDDLIVVSTTPELTAQGYLVPIVGYAPSKPDLSGVSSYAGDFNKKELGEAVAGRKLVADIVESWLKRGEDRPTICFAVDRNHARAIQQDFNESGIPCDYIDAHTDIPERDTIGKRLASGEAKIVVSVGCLIVGLDWTFVSCIIHARPTRSQMLWVQSVGRGLRTHEGKKDCVLLDHADNYNRLGIPELIHYDHLDEGVEHGSKSAKRIDQKKTSSKECKECGAVRPAGVTKCPQCGYEPVRMSDVEVEQGELIAINGHDRKAIKAANTQAEKELWYSGLMHVAFEKGYKPGWAAHQFKTKFGHWPDGVDAFPAEPTPHVKSWIRSRQIASAKMRQKLRAVG